MYYFFLILFSFDYYMFVVSDDDLQSESRGGGGGHETDDEGIERDSGEADDGSDAAGPSSRPSGLQEPRMTLTEVIDSCARRVTSSSTIISRQQQADSHYR